MAAHGWVLRIGALRGIYRAGPTRSPDSLAFRMDISVVLAPVRGQHRGSARDSASRQPETPDGFHRSPADYQRAGNPPASSLTSDRYFKAELERPVCLQVVAGPELNQRPKAATGASRG
jgi:hypothetical protein